MLHTCHQLQQSWLAHIPPALPALETVLGSSSAGCQASIGPIDALQQQQPLPLLQPLPLPPQQQQWVAAHNAAAGYKVVSISGFHWLVLHSKQGEEDYLLKMLKGC